MHIGVSKQIMSPYVTLFSLFWDWPNAPCSIHVFFKNNLEDCNLIYNQIQVIQKAGCLTGDDESSHLTRIDMVVSIAAQSKTEYPKLNWYHCWSMLDRCAVFAGDMIEFYLAGFLTFDKLISHPYRTSRFIKMLENLPGNKIVVCLWHFFPRNTESDDVEHKHLPSPQRPIRERLSEVIAL